MICELNFLVGLCHIVPLMKENNRETKNIILNSEELCMIQNSMQDTKFYAWYKILSRNSPFIQSFYSLEHEKFSQDLSRWAINISDNIWTSVVMSIVLYGCTIWTRTKRKEKKLDDTYTRMLPAVLNKSWRQHPTKQQLYGHLPPITKTIKVRRIRNAGHEFISDILLWAPSHGRAMVGRPARTYIQQLCADTGGSMKDLRGVMDDRNGWGERIREIRAGSMTWWWWWWCVFFSRLLRLFVLIILCISESSFSLLLRYKLDPY